MGSSSCMAQVRPLQARQSVEEKPLQLAQPPWLERRAALRRPSETTRSFGWYRMSAVHAARHGPRERDERGGDGRG
eukprot:1388422-Rhodomonas_salina.1